MKIIFLDFDGPLNTGKQWRLHNDLNQPTDDGFGTLFDPDCVEQLERIIAETGAKIVISSSWKRIMSYQDLLEMWEFRKLPGEVIDCTPDCSKFRGTEIDRWLKCLHEPCEYVIIDDLDESNFKQEQQTYLIQVDPFWGITRKIADRAITILGGGGGIKPVVSMNNNLFAPTSEQLQKAQMLIIPDVHGRTFWKSAVESCPDLPVIFLGDYLDPYTFPENINMLEAIKNFKEIIQFKQNNPERVTLLFGNHDLVYFDRNLDCSRKCLDLENEIYLVYSDCFHLFQLAQAFTIGNKNILFTHAGVLRGWYQKCFPNEPMKAQTIADQLNNRARSMEAITEFLWWGLWDVSLIRGGLKSWGSPVWADVKEHNKSQYIDDIFQVFGHTQQIENPIINTHFACLDCRRPFLLTTDGIEEIGKS